MNKKRKIVIGGSLAGVILVWICLPLMASIVIAVAILQEDVTSKIGMALALGIPTLGLFLWLAIYVTKLYKRAAFAYLGTKKMATIEKVSVVGGRTAVTKVYFSYKTDKGEEVIGVQNMPYCFRKSVKENMKIHVYVNGDYGAFRKEEIEYDVAHQVESEFE